MPTPEPVQNVYNDEHFELPWDASDYGERCKNKINDISLYLETKANWNIEEGTLELLASDLGVIVEVISNLEVTDIEQYKLFVARVFKKDGANIFIDHIKEVRKKLAVIANDKKHKKSKSEEMMDIMQKEIPSELKQAISQLKVSQSRRRRPRQAPPATD